MTIKKCKCGKEYEDMGFKTLCPSCYAKSVNGSQNQFKSHTANSKDLDIHRQVFLKVASEQRRGTTVKELIGYAKELEKAYNDWSLI